jgi:NADH pyrophosphatase NudC (nudix superfamily)
MDRSLVRMLAASVAFVRHGHGMIFSSALTIGTGRRWCMSSHRHLKQGGCKSSQLLLVSSSLLSSSVVRQQSTSLHVQSSSSSTSASSIWYSDPKLNRGDVPFTPPNDINFSSPESARFLLLQDGERAVCHLTSVSGELKEGKISPLFLTFDQVQSMMGEQFMNDLLGRGEHMSGDGVCSSLIWLGNHDSENGNDTDNSQRQYWAIYNGAKNSEDILNNDTLQNAARENISNNDNEDGVNVHLLPLREFGDRISNSQDAAIHSIANGLIEFHKSHKFCSTCGSQTIIQKAGVSRLCSNNKRNGGSCTAPSIYPRIDVASIMLITSPCENYALLGRKASWPSGRYSTLAGFLEIGETLEECCARETLEESGISVDKNSISFVRSQPWPFPRSLMAGFRARAHKDQELEDSQRSLPKIDFDEKEMEDVQWFRRDFVAERLDGGSTALLYDPTDKEKEFHIPGKASLARSLITSWALENDF